MLPLPFDRERLQEPCEPCRRPPFEDPFDDLGSEQRQPHEAAYVAQPDRGRRLPEVECLEAETPWDFSWDQRKVDGAFRDRQDVPSNQSSTGFRLPWWINRRAVGCCASPIGDAFLHHNWRYIPSRDPLWPMR